MRPDFRPRREAAASGAPAPADGLFPARLSVRERP